MPPVLAFAFEQSLQEGAGAAPPPARRRCAWAATRSTMAPRSMKITSSATSRAKPISCVTTSIVMPRSARSAHGLQHLADQLRIERRCHLVEQHDARAHGERAGDGRALLLAAGQARRDRRRACRRGRPAAAARWPCASASAGRHAQHPARRQGDVLRCTVRWGNRLKLWNTMPTSWRSAAQRRGFGRGARMLRRPFDNEPARRSGCARGWIGSRRAMQRSSVLLPEPLGPMTTMHLAGRDVQARRGSARSPHRSASDQVQTTISGSAFGSCRHARCRRRSAVRCSGRRARSDRSGRSRRRRRWSGSRPAGRFRSATSWPTRSSSGVPIAEARAVLLIR